MRPSPCREVGSLLDLCGRIMLTHDLGAPLAERALRISHGNALAMIGGMPLSAALDEEQVECLRLFVNILVRLEVRCRHDGRAIRAALVAPLGALGGAAPADRLGEGIEALRLVRAAIDHLELPSVRWWRIGH